MIVLLFDAEVTEQKEPRQVHLYPQLYTHAQVIPTLIRGLDIVTGIILHIGNLQPAKQVRDIFMFDMPYLEVYTASRLCTEVTSVMRGTMHTGERQDILDYCNSEEREGQSISPYTADLSALLLLCGDVESNPGPTTTGEKPDPQSQQTEEVSTSDIRLHDCCLLEYPGECNVNRDNCIANKLIAQVLLALFN